jgi:hypothetical protein
MTTPRYTYARNDDGSDATFDIWDIRGDHLIDSIPIWDAGEEAEEQALILVHELNLSGPRHVRDCDDAA